MTKRLPPEQIVKEQPHMPTDKSREQAQTASGLGLPHEQIGALLGIDDKTLRKHYRIELDLGKAKSSANVAKTLYSKAIGGDVTSMIWWTKAQMRWAETQRHENTGPEGEPQEWIVRWKS